MIEVCNEPRGWISGREMRREVRENQDVKQILQKIPRSWKYLRSCERIDKHESLVMHHHDLNQDCSFHF